MKATTAGLVIGLGFLIFVGVWVASGRLQPGTTANPTSTSAVTLEDLIAGKFPTALDKQGTGGMSVTVRGLLVLYVHTEADGDWHVAVTDGKVSVFITEITPAYQSSLGMPATGSIIDETGTPFCDHQHENESWHGNTCWEIHPVESWSVSSVNTLPGYAIGAAVWLPTLAFEVPRHEGAGGGRTQSNVDRSTRLSSGLQTLQRWAANSRAAVEMLSTQK